MAYFGDAGALFERYRRLFKHYETLESLSNESFDEISKGFSFDIIQKNLEEKMGIVKEIQTVSREISALKGSASLSEHERADLRRTEEELTLIVGRVIEMEDRSRSSFERHGVRVPR